MQSLATPSPTASPPPTSKRKLDNTPPPTTKRTKLSTVQRATPPLDETRSTMSSDGEDDFFYDDVDEFDEDDYVDTSELHALPTLICLMLTHQTWTQRRSPMTLML